MSTRSELAIPIIRAKLLAPNHHKLVEYLLKTGYYLSQQNDRRVEGMGTVVHYCDAIIGWDYNDGWIETKDAASLYLCMCAELIIQGDAIVCPNYP